MQRTTTWVATSVGGQHLGQESTILSTVETDSRQCRPGSLYVARTGESADGHDYAAAAVEAGAVAVICERPLKVTVPQVVVKDSTVALGELARVYLAELRDLGPITVVGVTGSVGKTTTKDLLGQIFSSVGECIWPVASFNNEVGCPLTILRATSSTRYLVLEMGSSGPGHLIYLTNIAPLDVAVELLVGKAHLEGFGSVQTLADSKAELVEGLLPTGTAVLNRDDPQVAAMAQLAPGRVISFSASGSAEANLRATGIELDALGRPSFNIETAGTAVRVKLQLVGAHQVTNALAAAAAAMAAGVALPAAATVLSESAAGSPHRMDVHRTISWHGVHGLTVIDDAYNANPDSLASGLLAARQIAGSGRLVTVIGEMLELGETSATLHAEAGEMVANVSPAAVVGVGLGTRPLLDVAGESSRAIFAADAAEATRELPAILEDADTVFLKGSYGSGVWRIADTIIGM